MSDETGIDFGVQDYTQEEFEKKYFTGPGNIENLYHTLNAIGEEANLDFGQGTRDEWLASFGYKRTREDAREYSTLDGRRIGGSQSSAMASPNTGTAQGTRHLRRPEPGERIQATYRDSKGNITHADSTQVVRGKVATVDVEVPSTSIRDNDTAEQQAMQQRMSQVGEIYLEPGAYSFEPDAGDGKMHYSWRNGRRIGQLDPGALRFAHIGRNYSSEAYNQAEQEAAEMTDEQLIKAFNDLYGAYGKDTDNALTQGYGRDDASRMMAYATEMRYRDVGMGHARDYGHGGQPKSTGVYHYHAAKMDPAVSAEMDRQDKMDWDDRVAYLSEVLRDKQARENAVNIGRATEEDRKALEADRRKLLAGSMLYARDNNRYPEEAYNIVVGAANNAMPTDTGFWNGFTSTMGQMWRDVKYSTGEAANLIADDRGDVIDAIEALDKYGEDAETKLVAGTLHNMGLLGMLMFDGDEAGASEGAGRVLAGCIVRGQDGRVDIDATRAALLRKLKTTYSWGDRQMRDNVYNTAMAKRVEGDAAWWGQQVAQLVPSAAAVAVGVTTRNPAAAQAIGQLGMGYMCISSGSQAMQEARLYGANENQVWTAGIVNAMLEYATEKIPFDRYTRRVFGEVKATSARRLMDAVADVNNPAHHEVQQLLEAARKELGNGTLVKAYTGDILAEGTSEFAAGTLQKASEILYKNPEDYPTFMEILEEGIEGFKGGAAMGGIMGGVSTGTAYFEADNRRKKAGRVTVGLYDRGDGMDVPIEIVGHDSNGNYVAIDGQHNEVIVKPDEVQGVTTYTYDEWKKGEAEQRQDQSFNEGYQAADEEQAGVKERLDVARQRLRDLGYNDHQMSYLEGLDEQGMLDEFNEMEGWEGEGADAVREFLNARAAYEGMVQHVQDDMEGAIAESEAAVDAQTHIETGAVHHAVLKTGGEVWVVGGNVALTPEGNIDIENSDGDLIVLDPATGGKRMIHVSDLASADEPVMADQLKQQAAADIQETMATEAANRIDGVLPFQPGDVYSDLPFGDETHTIQVIADGEDGVNVVVSIDGGEQRLMARQMIQEAADAQREARIAEQASNGGGATVDNGEGVMVNDIPGDNEASQDDAIPEQEAVEEEQPDEDAMPMNGDEVDWFATSPERGHRFLYDEAGLSPEEADAVVANSVKDAEKELEKVSKKAPKPGNAAQLNKYRAEKAAHEQQVAAAQAAVDYWKGVQATQQQIVADLVRRQADERAAQDAAARQAAIEAEAQYQAEQEAKKAEQAERGPFTPGQNVIDKWKSAKKIDGRKDVKVLADGTVVAGHYVLHEAGATTPSHDPATGWKPTEGFPVNENGGSVNDRDYERDRAAQEITIRMSETFDGRAYQDVPIISDEGIDYSGNGRTIAGDMAARNNTDGAYLETARQYSEKYGFTAEDMDQFQHPRVDFMLDKRLPYTPEVFAKFNAQEMKGQNLTESAVKLGKTVDDTTFNDIVGLINQFDTMSDFYADSTAPAEAISMLLRAGVITPMQHAQMFDGDSVSGQGKEMLENLLLGKAFEGNPDAIRQIRSMPSVRQQIVGALAEVANNSTLGDYSLEDVISQAVALVHKARNDKNSSVKQGDSVSDYARQLSLFPNITGGATIADLQNTMVLLLGDILNGRGQLTFKNVLIKYNYSASQTVGYTGSFFTDASPDGLLKDAIQLINNSNKNEIKQEITAAVEQRKSAARQGSEPVTAVNTGDDGGAAGEPVNDRRGDSQLGTGRQGDLEAPEKITDEERTAMQSRIVDWLSDENLSAASGKSRAEIFDFFGNDPEPIAYIPLRYLPLISKDVKDPRIYCGKGYFIDHALRNHGREGTQASIDEVDVSKYLNIQTVLDNPDAIKETFVDGKRTVVFVKKIGRYFAELTQVEEDGKIILHKSLFSQKKEPYAKLSDIRSKNSSSEGGTSSISHAEDSAPAISLQSRGDDMSETSGGKGTQEVGTEQEKSGKSVGAAVASAEGEVDTEPTEGQKEAGNYKKGHVKIDGFDVTIEQPKGSVRSGVDASGKAWSQEMHNTYGYIRGTEGVDGDHIDVFLSDHLDSWNGMVYVVDQVNKDGSFDEHKVMYGFDSEQEARDAYLSNYEEGWTGLGNITGVTRDEFKKWVDSSHRKTKPFAEYKSVKPVEADNGGAAAAHGTGRTIQGLEDYTEEEILEDVRAFIEEQLEDAGIEGVTIKGMALHGSRMRGDARPDSDLDVVVEYEGDISEDAFFNLLNYDLDFRGPNGIIIDINPITEGKSGTLEQYMERSRRYDDEKRAAAAEATEPVQSTGTGDQAYTITHTKYTTKKNKELDVWLVKFSGEIDKKQATEIAKETRGWWDREHGGFLMRSEEAARDLAERVGGATSQSDAIPEQDEENLNNGFTNFINSLKVGDEVIYNGYIAEISDIITFEGKPYRFKLNHIKKQVLPLELSPVSQAAASENTSKPASEEPSQSAGTDNQATTNQAGPKRLVSDDRMAELKERFRKKLGGQLNVGVDPELLAIGAELAVGHIERGLTKFADYAKAMLEDVGDVIRPYLKSFYNAVREMPEAEEYADAMTPYDEVRKFDIANFDKEGPKDVVATAKSIVDEQKVEKDVVEVTEKAKKSSKKKKKKKDVSSQGVGSLFDLAPAEEETNQPSKQQDNGLPRTDELRSEGLPADSDNEGEPTSILGQTPGQESRGSDRGGDSSRGGELRENLHDGLRHADQLEGPSPKLNQNNNHVERGKDYAPKDVDARIEANIAAIELMKKLLESGKKATPKEMSVLRKFSGWGGLGKAFNESAYGWREDGVPNRLRKLLGEEGYQQAVMSRNSAYYTPAKVIDIMWDIARALGFKGGNVLEGSAGIGNILGLMPTDMSERSRIHAVEIDSTTGNILSLLYPDAKVEIQGFEETRVQNGTVDLSITNVPFVTGLHVIDTSGDKDLSKKFRDIHDFCIAKNVRKLREGGIGIFITSSGTLDNSQKLRDWIVSEGNSDVVGAFRLNNSTFGGTAATSDIIVVRKRVNGQKSPNAIDVSTVTGVRTVEHETGEYKTVKGKQVAVTKPMTLEYNRYFVEHPEMMGGEMAFGFEKGETYRETSKALYPKRGINQDERLRAFVEDIAGKDWSAETAAQPRPTKQEETVYEELGEGVKEGSMLVDGKGQLCVARYGQAVPLEVNANKVKGRTKAQCFQDYCTIKDAVNAVLDYQTEHDDDADLQPLLDKLNKVFDDFVNTYGHFHKNTALSFLKNDMDFSSIAALEDMKERNDEQGKRVRTFKKSDIFNKRVVEKETEPKPTTIKDGVITSIYKFGRVDVPYISEQLGMSADEVKSAIVQEGIGFENPMSREIEVSYEYLSGNVREKLRQAIENNEDGQYDANVKALEAVIPMNIPAHLIEFTLGSSWLDPKLYSDFIKERTGVNARVALIGGTWIVDVPGYYFTEQNRAMGVESEMCGKVVYGHELIAAAMQNKTVRVSKTTKFRDGGSETIVDKVASQACATKIDEIRQDFKDWAREKMQSDPDMSAQVEEVYNESFNNYVPREIPDSFVPDYFGGASHHIKLNPHQAKAAIRATTQNVMLAHEVGTGKTFTLITTAMEMRRLGTARKPMIVVQNATVGQFVASAKELYPKAKVLTLEDADRTAEGRKAFYAKIKYNDWDMIVIPQSAFEMIPDSEERQMNFVRDKIDEKMLVLEQMEKAGVDTKSMAYKQAEREVEKLEEELNIIAGAASEKRKQRDEKREAKTRQNAAVQAREMLDRKVDDVEDFDQMGIDAILVDEAHEYKHLGFATAMQRGVKGVDPSYSKKSQGVFLKCQAVMERTGGKNVVFATGTPISNTAAEIWTFMRYLYPAETLKDYGIYYFDDFVRNFGNISQMLEFATNGRFKENNRFAGYVNLPELVRIWSGVSDTVRTEEVGNLKGKIPEMEGGKAQDIYLPQTRALRSVMKYVNAELERYENMSGKEKKENSHIPLTMYGIAKAAAVDARLVLQDAEDEPNSKTNEAVRQTLKSLEDTASYRGTVAIFADNYQNKQSGFNLYEDIRKKLIDAGVPADQIVVMKSGMSVNKKLEIFDKVNAGEIRVIMGSTFTLGTGVNIQERLHTLIHVDAPNRPMDYTQRNGRILRQGNIHKEMGKPVRVLRFGVEDSLDVTAYQRLKTKGAIADSIMHGKAMMSDSMENRTMEEDEDVFGDVVAQLSGSEYALLKNQAEREVRKLEAKRKQYEADQIYIHSQKPRLAGYIRASRQAKAEAEAALKALEGVDMSAGITVGKQHFNNADEMGDFIKEYNKKITEDMDRIRKSFMSEDTVREMNMNIGGFDFVVRTVMARDTEKRGTTLSTVTRRTMSYTCEALGLTEPVPVKQGLLRNAIEDIMQNVLTGKDARERVEAAESSIARNEHELEVISEREGRPFEQADELKEARDKLKEYEQLMKAELEAKEAKYADIDASVDAASPVEADHEDVLLREEDDADIIRELENGPTMKVYRSMILTPDGRLLPPMSEEEEKGKQRDGERLGTWYRSDERPDLARNGKFPLRQSDKRGNPMWVAYAPYFHSAETMLNDQFKRAQSRGNLVVVECEIPVSELSSGYRAEGSKKSVGLIKNWKAGDLQTQTSGTRNVYLSRWIKPVRVVPVEEVAQHIYELIDGTGVIMPTNIVTPQLRAELEKLGVPFIETTNQGIVAEGEHKGEYYTKAYPMPHPEKFGFKRDLQLRDALVEGGRLAIINQGGKWRIEGMPGEFGSRYATIEEWRERAAGNVVWYMSEDGNHIEVEGNGDMYEMMSFDTTTRGRKRRERMARQQATRSASGRRMVDELADKLGVKVRYVDDMTEEERAQFSDRQLRGKGWYNPRTGEVFINLGRHTRLYDILSTFLHEAVAHKGLRRLFGKDFNAFVDNVYNNVNKGIRAEIDRMAEQQKSRASEAQRARHDDEHWRRVATEEYMAKLAERLDLNHPEQRTLWEKIRGWLIDHLRKVGVMVADSLNDSDLRGILWESYHNMQMEGVVGYAKGKAFRDQMEREANNRGTATAHGTNTIAAEPRAQYTGSLFDVLPQAGAWARMMSNMSERELFSEMAQDGPNVTSSYSEEYDRRHIKEYNQACDEIQARLERELPGEDRLLELLQDAEAQWADGAYKDSRRTGMLAAIDTISRALDEERADLPRVEEDVQAEGSQYDNSGGVGLLGESDEPYNQQRANDIVRNFPHSHAVKEGFAAFCAVDSEDALEQAIADNHLTDEEAEDLREKYNDPGTLGCALREGKDLIAIFTHKLKSLKDLEEVNSHETMHIAYGQLGREEHNRFNNAILNWFRSKSWGNKFIDALQAEHDPKDWADETMAYFVGHAVKKHGWKKFFSGKVNYGNEEINNFVSRIKEIIINEEEFERLQDQSNADAGRNGSRGRAQRPTEDNNRLRQPASVREAGEVSLTPASNKAQEQQGGQADGGVTPSDEDLRFNDSDDDDDVAGFDAGRLTFEESITAGMLKAAADNRAAIAARTAAMRALGGNLSKLRQAMARQREYDRGTVDSIVRLARSVMESGFFRAFSPYEVKRLMSLINHAAGREDITKQAGKVVDLLLKHQLLSCENLLHEQMRTRGSKLNSQGVEVQAGLDIEGQRMVGAMRHALNLEADALQERINNTLDRMFSPDQALADVAAAEYQGLLLAQQYIEDIKGSKQEENELRQELKNAKEDLQAGTITREQYNQFVAETENAIRENRLERVAAYDRLTTALGAGLGASVQRAKEWREAQRERVNEIRHNANSDLEGIPADEHVKPGWMQRAANWSLVRFFMKPLATFDYMLRMLGSKNVNGEGYLWGRFMGGWTEATEREWRNLRAAHKALDEKASEVFGKKMRWSDLFSIERKMPGMDVSFWDAGEEKIHHLTQGNLLYIYMVNKMSDGRMKLRKMGINEEDVEAIRQRLDPRFIELADWLQEEFLVNKRNDYNAVYQRMFGASMAAIEHYFPLKINSRSRGQEEDLSSETYLDDNNIGSTITGSIIKRKRNSLPLDVTGADAFDVVLGHLQDMEHWAAFAEFNRDLNTLLSYKRFRNRLLNMSSVRFGSGKTLWMNFKRTCAIASGAYRPKMDRDSVDTSLVNVAKGVTAAKISFRIYTALKQLLSYPAYLSEASGLELIKSSSTPIGWVKSWNWAIDNLPGFAQRWQSRQAGDSRLRESDADWGVWRNKIVETAGRWGMSPNALVDAWTVAMGAKAIYETKLKRYRKAGYPDEQAKRRALRDASISYNETQQSNANAYLSAMQLDRSAASVALTVFRNASMGYQRRMFQAIANLKHVFTPGYKAQALEFMTKQMVRDGLSEQQAKQSAERIYRRAKYKNLADVAIFGWVMQMAWNLGPYIPYLLMGDDDDDKKEMLEDSALHAIAGGVEGLSGGNVMSDTYNAFRSGEVSSYVNTELLPLMSDIESLKRKLGQDMVEGAHDLVNLAVQAGVGVNPQQITDLVAAVLDVADGDPKIAHEAGFVILRVLSVPQSQLDKLYIDELGLTARDARKLNAGQMAERYARYRMRRGSAYTSWAYSDEGKRKAEEHYMKRFETKVKERIAELDDEQLEDNFNTDDDLRRKWVGQAVAKRAGGTDSYGSPDTDYGVVYERKRDYTDLAQDILLQIEKKKAKEAGDSDRYKALDRAQRELTTIKKGKHTTKVDEPGLGEGFDDEVMTRLRERRKELMKELGIM